MSNYEAGTMTGGQVLDAILKRPELYGLCRVPERNSIAKTIAQSMDPEYGFVCDVDLLAADAVLALIREVDNQDPEG